MSDRDEAMRQAERKGARAALTRFAEEQRLVEGGGCSRLIERWRDKHVPAPRVRAGVRDGAVEWRLYWDMWEPRVHGTAPYQDKDPTRAAVAGMFWAQQRADAAGFVSADDVASRGGASLDGTEEGLGAAAADGAALASDRQEPSGSAPTPAPCEWRVVVKDPRATAHVSLTFYPREWPSGSDEYGWHTHNANVREVRPLTAAQVEALAWALYRADGGAVGAPVHLEYLPQARAALAHLGIPYEEA